MLVLRALHVLGAILWIGGVASIGVIVSSVEADARPKTVAAARRAVRWLVSPGMGLAWLPGLAMLLTNFTELYARAGWMHTKLLLIVIASGLTGAMTGRLRRAEAGDEKAHRSIRVFALVVLGLAAAVVGLAILQPG
jgi:putative membrane protein